MRTIGIICEYNPFHNGHYQQIQMIRQQFGNDCCIVCAMSGNYVQRGMPAIFDKCIRAKAAVLSGADLVITLPIGVVLSSAEGFADGGVKLLSACCDILSFGTETLREDSLFSIARSILSDDFSIYLKEELASGCSFPAARQAALVRMGFSADIAKPNNLLGIEYCKAILANCSTLSIFPVLRPGDYHAQDLNPADPSATAIRNALISHRSWCESVPDCVLPLYQTAAVHTLSAGERAIIGKLRTMSEEDYEQLPYGSEGLWRKLYRAVRKNSDLSAIIEETKSKRYTRTRIDRMIMCAFLGLTADDIRNQTGIPRVLAFSDRGRTILRNHPEFQNVGANISEDERRIEDLYDLFTEGHIPASGSESERRVFYCRGDA